mmetsp:Transcript_25375/g.52733  ORF Transcript_25375/g.52733 Transcript_25375/m.52733 type:complete len:264 (+) Transcript_25375:479-1270(+)
MRTPIISLASQALASSAKKLQRPLTFFSQPLISDSTTSTWPAADFKNSTPFCPTLSLHLSTTSNPPLRSSAAFRTALRLFTLAATSRPFSSALRFMNTASPAPPSPAIICTTRSITVVFLSVPLVKDSFSRLSRRMPATFGLPMLSFMRFPTARTFFNSTPKFLLSTILAHADPRTASLDLISSALSLNPSMTQKASQMLETASTLPTARKKRSHFPSLETSPFQEVTEYSSFSVGRSFLRLLTFSRSKLASSKATTALINLS